MINDRPHRLDLIYVDQPVYFVTFATRDRKSIPSLHRAQLALEEYGHSATSTFNVPLGRYVIMPDHVHLFVRGGRNFTFSSWIGGLKRAISVALGSPRIWQPGFFDHILRSDESYAEKWNYVRDNLVRWPCGNRRRVAAPRRNSHDRSSVTVAAGVSPVSSFAADTAASTEEARLRAFHL